MIFAHAPNIHSVFANYELTVCRYFVIIIIIGILYSAVFLDNAIPRRTRKIERMRKFGRESIRLRFLIIFIFYQLS